ncbi:two component regulator with propeller domain [Mucilaginibacter gracilis]|uniref:histidine kinase n=1 Tax=Mucilaginibacter gracilis TaxID=423350 RepID=A0A495IUV9_9SPHI|nr:hybrid sensor histidine kinase/response regulator transcription factor [Mucilaginibacter gracilis]RKR80547.1 two component regulator with propeller domain [Mucilaginibacter gracilis]
MIRFFLVSFLLLLNYSCFAQSLGVFKPIDTRDGLSENSLRSILQLPDGQMVFVNEGIINLYNGASFQYLHINENFSYPIPGYTGLHHIYSDNNGHLWLKRYGELLLIDLKLERQEENLAAVLASYGIKESLSDFYIDSQHNLWLITKSGKLFLKKSSSHRAELFLSLSDIEDSDPISDVAYDNGIAYFFLHSGIMIAMDMADRKVLFKQNTFEGLTASNYNYTTYVIKGSGKIFLLRNRLRGLLLVFDIHTRKWTKVLDTPYNLNTLSISPQCGIIVTVHDGLWVMDNDLKNIKFNSILNLTDGRSINTEISTSAYDHQGGLWLGTFSKGLLFYNPASYKIKQVDRSYFPLKNKRELNIKSFAELDSGKTVLLGTDQGIFLYDFISDKIQIWPLLPTQSDNQFIFKDSRKNVWIAQADMLVKYLNGKLTVINIPEVTKMVEDGQKRLFIIGKDNKLYKLNPQANSIEPVYNKIEGRSEVLIASDFVCKGNKLYGVSGLGVFVYDEDNQTASFDRFSRNYSFRQLNNHQFNCLAIDSLDRLWIGTQDGLCIWNFNTKKLFCLHTENGLINNGIKSITQDAKNNIWVATAYGVSRLENITNLSKISFTNFSKNDGIISDQFYERANLKISNNNILIGGIDGFNIINTSIYRLTQPLKPVFGDLVVQGEHIKPGINYDGHKILNQSVTTGGTVSLNYLQNFFNISFSAFNYANPSHTLYRYKLNGNNDVWHQTQTADGIGQATYTSLAPGHYQLQVQVLAPMGKWDTNNAFLDIIITPPWWKSWPMILLYWITGIFLMSWIVMSYKRRAKFKIEAAQEIKLNELKFNFFTNMSHEIRTPLTLILTPLEIMIKNISDEKLKFQLGGIYKNARHLLDMVNQLLDFKRLHTSQSNLHLTLSDIAENVQLICEPFKELALLRSIRLEINTPGHLWMYLDTEKFSVIINNLLSNAFKFTADHGAINITVEQLVLADSDAKMVEIRITDNGAGISAEDIPSIFNRFFQASNHALSSEIGNGIGLHLVKEYVKLHQGNITVESELNKGTMFKVSLPTNLEPCEKQPDLKSEPNTEEIDIPKILIAEDNDELRTVVVEQLKGDYQVTEVANGRDALDTVLRNGADLIISDVMMPGLNGFDLCHAIKNDLKTSHIPIILLTAKGAESSQIEGYQAKADAYITKPFNMELLQLRIRNLLEDQKKRKDLFKNAVVIPLSLAVSSDIDEKFIKKLIDSVEKNLSNLDYSVEQLSSDMNMERSGLYRKVVALTGLVPSMFIRSVRLKKAAQLLLTKGYSVSQIAEITGFNSSGYFSKCFQEEFGVKPSQYNG